MAETTAELYVAGTRKTPTYSSSTHRFAIATPAELVSGRSYLHGNNRVRHIDDHVRQTQFPSIRDAKGSFERHNRSHDDLRFYARSKSHFMDSSPKSTARPPTASFSTIFNALAKRSMENITHTDAEDAIVPSHMAPRRRSQHVAQPVTDNRPKRKPTAAVASTVPVQKQSGDSGIDIRFSSSSGDTNQQQRALGLSANQRTMNVPQVYVAPPTAQEPTAKERTTTGKTTSCSIQIYAAVRTIVGQMYQRRPNKHAKAPIKQKIDKYRRRSEEVIHAMNGDSLMNASNNFLSTTMSTLVHSRTDHSKPVDMSTVDTRRQSMETELAHHEHHSPVSQQPSRPRTKSPHALPTRQQLVPPVPAAAAQKPSNPVQSTSLRRAHRSTQATSSANLSQQQHRRSQQQSIAKQAAMSNAVNLYLAFLASRHLSALDDASFENEIDHQKLLNMFIWLQDVEDHRHEQISHDQLLLEQNQRTADEEESFSLYSEIKYAVDDLPANTTGRPCEKIPTIQFEN